MKIIGLTGGSGAGKTTAALILKELGCFIIDCDEISHSVTKPDGSAYKEVVSFFGEDILNSDRTINRRILGEKVFSDAASLKKLEEITHFYIKREVFGKVWRKKAENRQSVVIDAPLLYETGLDRLCDEVWLIYADEKTRLERLIKRDGLGSEALKARLKNQTDVGELLKRADFALDTTELSVEEMSVIIKKQKEK